MTFTYKDLLNIESAIMHLLKETKPHDQSQQMREWRAELDELLTRVQTAQEEHTSHAA